jgi:hypothetical protein
VLIPAIVETDTALLATEMHWSVSAPVVAFVVVSDALEGEPSLGASETTPTVPILSYTRMVISDDPLREFTMRAFEIPSEQSRSPINVAVLQIK